MNHILRRAPWIALGAATAYLADPEHGAARRRSLAHNARALANQIEGSCRGVLAGRSTLPGGDRDGAQLTATVSTGNVATRASDPLPEETAAGVSDEESAAMAAQILGESEQRVTDRSNTAGERRRSEDTVAPVAG